MAVAYCDVLCDKLMPYKLCSKNACSGICIKKTHWVDMHFPTSFVFVFVMTFVTEIEW